MLEVSGALGLSDARLDECLDDCLEECLEGTTSAIPSPSSHACGAAASSAEEALSSSKMSNTKHGSSTCV